MYYFSSLLYIIVSLFGTLKYIFRCKQVFFPSEEPISLITRSGEIFKSTEKSISPVIAWIDAFSCQLPQQFLKKKKKFSSSCFGPGCSSVGWKEERLCLHTLDLRLMPSSFDHKQTWNLAHESLRRRRTTWGVTPCAYSVRTTLIFFFPHRTVNSSAWLRLDASEGPHVDERKAWLVRYEEGSGQEVTGTKKEEGQSLDPSLSVFCFISQLLTSSYSFPSPGTLLIVSVRGPPPASCVVFAHAGSQHQSALLRHLWVFHHALPQPLLLPVGVHPVHLAAVAQAWRAGGANVSFGCVEGW